MKTIVKTESHAEFLARGGKITKCPTKDASKKYSRKAKPEVTKIEEVPADAFMYLPESLKISYGIK